MVKTIEDEKKFKKLCQSILWAINKGYMNRIVKNERMGITKTTYTFHEEEEKEFVRITGLEEYYE
jgi:hypothetical protein